MVSVDLQSKVHFLKQPQTYPDQSSAVEAVETHMSWVFLTRSHAYKLKKPVKYEFLDYSTLENRMRCCQEEVRLNRRLARDVYLEVAPLTLEPDGRMRLEGSGEVIDFLVKMRRLPAEQMLDFAISHDAPAQSDVFPAALLLAGFYRQAEPVRISNQDYRDRLKKGVQQQLRELATPRYRLPINSLQRIESAQLDFLRNEADLFEKRIEQGRVIEGHGDLRPEHICIAPRPVIIDCLEFNREFRIVDPVDELSFLALECERLGAPWVGKWFLETYVSVCKDRPGAKLFRFYQSNRACLRAELAVWHTREPDNSDAERWLALGKTYLGMAERCVECFLHG